MDKYPPVPDYTDYFSTSDVWGRKRKSQIDLVGSGLMVAAILALMGGIERDGVVPVTIVRIIGRNAVERRISESNLFLAKDKVGKRPCD